MGQTAGHHVLEGILPRVLDDDLGYLVDRGPGQDNGRRPPPVAGPTHDGSLGFLGGGGNGQGTSYLLGLLTPHQIPTEQYPPTQKRSNEIPRGTKVGPKSPFFVKSTIADKNYTCLQNGARSNNLVPQETPSPNNRAP